MNEVSVLFVQLGAVMMDIPPVVTIVRAQVESVEEVLVVVENYVPVGVDLRGR
jgi:hypothetical protein